VNDGGDFLFVDALQHLVEALDTEANLNSAGRATTNSALMSSLAAQVSARRNVERHPEIGSLAIRGPVFIIGLPGTDGATLHNLLAQHPGVHAPRLWELLTPAGPRDPQHRMQAIRAAQVFIDDWYGRGRPLPGQRLVGALLPAECHKLLVNTFQSMVFVLRYHVPSYVRWLRRRNMTPAYRYHRFLLQSIRWRMPDGLLVLNCPFHIWSLAALARVYPDALFVHLHRNPAAVIPSICGLCAALRGVSSDSVDRRAIGADWLRHVARALAGMEDARRHLVDGRRIIDVRHRDLVEDPLATAGRICDFIGLPMTISAIERMRGYLAANPPDWPGVDVHTVEDFGLSSARIDERFAAYRRTFDL